MPMLDKWREHRANGTVTVTFSCVYSAQAKARVAFIVAFHSPEARESRDPVDSSFTGNRQGL